MDLAQLAHIELVSLPPHKLFVFRGIDELLEVLSGIGDIGLEGGTHLLREITVSEGLNGLVVDRVGGCSLFSEGLGASEFIDEGINILHTPLALDPLELLQHTLKLDLLEGRLLIVLGFTLF